MRRPPSSSVLLAAIMVLSACGGNGQAPADPVPSPVDSVACSFPFPAPFGWKSERSAEVDQGSHVGHQEVVSNGDRVLVYSAGVLRDQFETAPLREGLKLTNGGDAYLFAIEDPLRSEGFTLFWYGPEPCKQYAIDSMEGFSRPGDFLQTMREIGVLEP